MINYILATSVRYRYAVLLVTVIAAVCGAWSLARLPIDAVPDVTNNQVQINAIAPSLTPIEIEKQVTVLIERALAGTAGLEAMRSFSRNGFAQLTAVFSDQMDLYLARQQVNERLIEVRADLPPGVEVRLGPISTGLGEIYWWSVEYMAAGEGGPVTDGAPGWQSDGSYLTPEGQKLTDDFQRTVYLRTVQDWIIRPQIKSVPGVAGADAIGGYVKEFQVEPDPAKLVAYGLSFREVVAAIETNNSDRGANYVEKNGEGYIVRSGGRVETLADIADIVVATRGGVPIRIHNVANVTIGRELRTGSASENGREIVLGTALMLIGGNSRTVAAAADAKIVAINRMLPSGIRARTMLSRTELVDATVHTVTRNLAEGALLVIAVLFLMLGNFRAAVITALVIPLSMLLTATGMLTGRISANLMSLGALDFGLIVDGAVIIAENCLRRLAERQRVLARTLALDERLATVTASSEEMIKPTVYGQAIIILVYLPLLTFSGVEGKTFAPMAFTVLIALSAAFLLSLTFIPAMIATFVTGRVREHDNFFVRAIRAAYAPALAAATRVPILPLLVALGLFVGACGLFATLGQEFTPTLDEKNIVMEARRIPSTSLTQSQAMQLGVEDVVSRFEQVKFVFSRCGTPDIAADPMPPNACDTYLILKPQSEWPDPAQTKDQLIAQLEVESLKIPGTRLGFSQPIQMRFNELIAGVRDDIAVKIYGEDFEPMVTAANKIAAILRGIEGAADVKVEEVTGLPFLDIKVDKREIARRGINLAVVQDVIGTAVGGKGAGLVFEGDRRFKIVVRLADSVRGNVEILKNLPVPQPLQGGTGLINVPLRQLASFTFTEGPNQVSREDGRRFVAVTANARGRDIGSLVAQAQDRIARDLILPAGYEVRWGGQFKNLSAARARLMVVVPVCFALVFLLLLGALGTARDALMVFSAVPLALTGGITALWLRDMPFSVSAAVGLIALSGVSVLNGLVLLNRIQQLVEQRLDVRAAVMNGAMTRLRPVVMTALVAALGFIPMAVATGTGAEVQKPLATVVIGGLISATLLTLLVLPALYILFGKAKPESPLPSRPLGSGVAEDTNLVA